MTAVLSRVPESFALVFLGGTVGTGLRYAADVSVGVVGGWPVATLLVNLIGAFALGWLHGRTSSQRWRLLLGTGLLGGFTTYSALAVQTQELLEDTALTGIAYATATVAIGMLAARLGSRLGESR
ncbi:CrcB family protein [uncultured Aeromicrobium sp.]|uniref:fluoride efflux transporter FluC n=1 Tax=uncultured Aeromicrobium sp. TaxID=337820 RepID=UPI0025EC0A69|nr:CrcB family protein [uncultured Aeromicrobium sp.]